VPSVILRALAALTLGLFVAVGLGCSPSDEAQAPPTTTAPSPAARATAPNIVLILADDLGYGDLGSYNPESKIPTPHIDALAREGVRLVDAHSSASICTPSRYAIWTGTEPFRETRVSNSLQPLSPPALQDETWTLPEVLRRAGYTTALVGKWHLGRRYTWKAGRQPVLHNVDWTGPLTDGPMQHGFDRFFGLARPAWAFLEDGVPLAAPTEEYDLGDVPEELYGKRAGRGLRAPGFRFEQVLPRYTAWAVDFIEQSAERDDPFFLAFAPAVPHTPIAPSARFQGATPVGPYGDIVAELDDSVGQIAAALERIGASDETLIVFTSDNGPETHAYERLRQTGHASMGPLRGAKHSLFEGGHRIPFIATWPGHIPAGAISSETLSLVDLMASFASAAGTPLPAHAAPDSYDMLPALTRAPESAPTAPIRNATFASRGRRIVTRQDHWILLESGGGGRPEPLWFLAERGIVPSPHQVALFDLANDLGQQHNVAEAHAERVEQLRAERKAAASAAGTAPKAGGAAAHIQVRGEGNNDLMAQVQEPRPIASP